MTKGQVKWFDPKKGYGFIIGPENQDVFVHYSHIQSDGFRSLKDGEWVEYELVEGDKGWQARDVKSTGEGGEVPASAGGGGGGGGGGGKREGGRQGGGGKRPQRDRERSSDILTDRPRSAPKTVDRPPVDRPAGGGYESGPASSGYEGYQGSEDD